MNVLIISNNSDMESCVAAALGHVTDITLVGRLAHNREIVSQVEGLDARVIVVDTRMAGMRGLDTIYRLRLGLPELAIIAVGSMATKYSGRSTCECGADQFIHSSDLESLLLPALWSASARHGYLPPGKTKKEPGSRPTGGTTSCLSCF